MQGSIWAGSESILGDWNNDDLNDFFSLKDSVDDDKLPSGNICWKNDAEEFMSIKYFSSFLLPKYLVKIEVLDIFFLSFREKFKNYEFILNGFNYESDESDNKKNNEREEKEVLGNNVFINNDNFVSNAKNEEHLLNLKKMFFYLKKYEEKKTENINLIEKNKNKNEYDDGFLNLSLINFEKEISLIYEKIINAIFFSDEILEKKESVEEEKKTLVSNLHNKEGEKKSKEDSSKIEEPLFSEIAEIKEKIEKNDEILIKIDEKDEFINIPGIPDKVIVFHDYSDYGDKDNNRLLIVNKIKEISDVFIKKLNTCDFFNIDSDSYIDTNTDNNELNKPIIEENKNELIINLDPEKEEENREKNSEKSDNLFDHGKEKNDIDLFKKEESRADFIEVPHHVEKKVIKKDFNLNKEEVKAVYNFFILIIISFLFNFFLAFIDYIFSVFGNKLEEKEKKYI